MKFRYIGINYKNTKQDVRDKIAFTDQKKLDFLMKAEALGINQCLILSTCNRNEVYFWGDEAQEKELWEIFCNAFPDAGLSECLQKKSDRDAALYFFRVTAGMESLVPGEDQILGQVGDAAEFSRAAGMMQKELNKIAREAVSCAKKIKTQLNISSKPLSIAYIGVKLLEERYGISGRKALVVGSGKTAELLVRYLFSYHAGKVIICSRSADRARPLTEEFPDTEWIPFSKRYETAAECGLILSATAAPHAVIKREELKAALCCGKGGEKGIKERVFLDLAAPRDIEPSVSTLPGCDCVDLERLEGLAEDNRREREELLKLGESTLEEAVEELLAWLKSSRVDETIHSLRQRCDEIVEDTYAYLSRKLTLAPREQKLLKKMLAASLKRLLREPILELKQLDTPQKQEEYQRVVRELFRIQEDENEL